MTTTYHPILKEFEIKESLYRDFTKTVAKLLKQVLADEGIPTYDLHVRVKGKNNLEEKVMRPGKFYKKLEDITDLAGLRVITYYADDVDRVAKAIEKEFILDEANVIDKRRDLEPDRFGYLSLHDIVMLSPERLQLREYKKFQGMKAEIQIRSILQHTWAEIEHDLGYKSERKLPSELRRSFSRLAGLLEIADQEKALDLQ